MARSAARFRISLRDHKTATTLKIELIESPSVFGDRRYRIRVNNRASQQVTVATLTEIFERLRRWLVRRA